jgi:hypothetical protein
MTEETLRFRNIVPNNRIFHKWRSMILANFASEIQTVTMRSFIFKSLLLSSLLFAGLSANAQGPFPMFNNRTHSVEAQPFAYLSQRIWDLMADKNADALKEIFHPNAMFVHMGGYWDCAQELATIGGGFIHYKHAEVYGVDVKQINADNWAVYSNPGHAVGWGNQDIGRFPGGSHLHRPCFYRESDSQQQLRHAWLAFACAKPGDAPHGRGV